MRKRDSLLIYMVQKVLRKMEAGNAESILMAIIVPDFGSDIFAACWRSPAAQRRVREFFSGHECQGPRSGPQGLALTECPCPAMAAHWLSTAVHISVRAFPPSLALYMAESASRRSFSMEADESQYGLAPMERERFLNSSESAKQAPTFF